MCRIDEVLEKKRSKNSEDNYEHLASSFDSSSTVL